METNVEAKTGRGYRISYLALFLSACGTPPQDATADSAQTISSLEARDLPAGIVHSIEVVDGKVVNTAAVPIPVDATKPLESSFKPSSVTIPGPRPKIDSLLQVALESSDGIANSATTTEVVVTFVDDVRIPRFSSPKESEPRDSVANRAVAERNRVLISEIEKVRAPNYSRLSAELAANHGARIRDTFWLISAMAVDVPIGQVSSIAARSDVVYVEQNQKPIGPPVTLASARSTLNTDPYFSLPQPTSWVGLLDTGVRSTHTLLAGNGGFLRDCVNGCSSNCQTQCGGTPLDPSDNFWNHGTSTMSILAGNSNLGNNNRGITPLVVDSFKVYNNSGSVVSAAVRGFQAAIAEGDRVIVAELQDTGADNSGIAAAADAAFDAGAVVVAAAGNFGPGAGSVRSPGKAAKVLAVGEGNSDNTNVTLSSGRGATSDGRTKPDLVGITDITAASNANDTALRTFNGTSCATPTVAGATALMRNFFRASSGSPFEFPPAQMNAIMILTGRNTVNASNDQNRGAGVPQLLPTNALYFYGNVNVTGQQNVDIPLNIQGPMTGVDAALWWPEPPNQTHSDVDLLLYNPNGVQVVQSAASGSVFEKVRATTQLVGGTWTLRVSGFNVTGTQSVYFAVARR